MENNPSSFFGSLINIVIFWKHGKSTGHDFKTIQDIDNMEENDKESN